MPEISRFFGIRILMFYNDHAPPHFHAEYGGQRVSLEIQSLAVIEGQIQRRALGMVVEWARARVSANSRRIGSAPGRASPCSRSGRWSSIGTCWRLRASSRSTGIGCD
jgi:hypothetical protein